MKHGSLSLRVFTLAQRELREHRRAFFWAPLLIAVLFATAMLVSVLAIDRLSVFGTPLVQVIKQQAGGGGAIIAISDDADNAGQGSPVPPAATADLPTRPASPDLPDDAWDFERDWVGVPVPDSNRSGAPVRADDERIPSLNPLLTMLHNSLLLVLMIAVSQYLLATLYEDRKDRSILFWRSLPVNEWESVLSKLGVALVIAPAILIAISIVLQIVTTLVAILMVWQRDMAPMAVLMSNLAPGRLLVDQVGGWVLSALWLAPVCAWLLLASAAAKRSPFLLAVTPVIVAILIEELFLNTGFVLAAIGRHVPQMADGDDGVGFYLFGPDWSAVDWWSLLAGLVFAAVATTIAVYLRRHRWEI